MPRTLAVFGAMGDKDLKTVLEPFVKLVDAWFVGSIDSDRGAKPVDLASLLRLLGAPDVSTYADVHAAAQAARAASADRVLAFGSFYTVGPALDAVRLY